MDSDRISQLCAGKTAEQKKVIHYFLDEGCRFGVMEDEQYMSMVKAKVDSLNLKEKALNAIGLDEDELKEIPPVCLGGFDLRKEWVRKTESGKWVSSAYQVTWLFFSDTQVFFYSYRFNLDEDKKREISQEFFYKDVTSITVTTEEEKTNLESGGKVVEVDSEVFCLVVPGDRLIAHIGNAGDCEQEVSAMKQKLREKKKA